MFQNDAILIIICAIQVIYTPDLSVVCLAAINTIYIFAFNH